MPQYFIYQDVEMCKTVSNNNFCPEENVKYNDVVVSWPKRGNNVFSAIENITVYFYIYLLKN